MTHTTAVHPPLHRAMSAWPGSAAGDVEIGVRYDAACSTGHPVSHGVRVLVKVLHDMELNRPLYYFTVPGMVFASGIWYGIKYLEGFSSW